MSNNIEHRIFWDLPAIKQPGNILLDHYGLDNIIDKQIKVTGKVIPICEHCKKGILKYDAKIIMDHSKIYMKPDENETA